MVKKVMVVHYDSSFLERIRELLDLSGYSVETVNDADAVIDVVNENNPNIIIVNLEMPRKTGFQIAYELRHNTQSHKIPILGLSTEIKNEQKEIYKNIYGINDIIKKDRLPLNLISRIERFS